jgi:hypothetical protein
MLHGGIIQYMGHSQFQWDLRKEASSRFSTLWNVDQYELATSFDGFRFMSGERKYQKKPMNSFLHKDQSPFNTIWSYQGLVNLIDSDSQSGGFVCVPKTHLIHRKYFEENHNLSDKRFKENWYLFTDKEKEENKILSEIIKVNCKSGDFILWDSRTFHCNTTPSNSNSRCCVYICMLPKSKVNENSINKRKKAFDEKRCTSHHEVKMFPVVPRFTQESDKVKNVMNKLFSEIILSKLLISLACID